MSNWRPIKTAPREGVFVLTCDERHYPQSVCTARHMTAAAFVIENGHGTEDDYEPGWWSDDDYTGPLEPTHWMPLPKPPETA